MHVITDAQPRMVPSLFPCTCACGRVWPQHLAMKTEAEV